MIENIPSSASAAHRHTLQRVVTALSQDNRLVGVAAAGSYLDNDMDGFSDLDLVIAVEPSEYADALANRHAIAASAGSLLAAFTGEHVGEPRLLICLYEDPLMHVDLKFVALQEIADRVEDPAVLWEREGRLSRALRNGRAQFPQPDPQWIEDRFWIWMHYGATKIGRGELFEALDFLSFLRGKVLGPLALVRGGGCPTGVRRLETVAPEFAKRLQETVATYDAPDCLRALRVCAELYRSVRPTHGVTFGVDAERSAMAYVDEIGRS